MKIGDIVVMEYIHIYQHELNQQLISSLFFLLKILVFIVYICFLLFLHPLLKSWIYIYVYTRRVLFISIHRYDNGEFWPNLRESNYDFIGTGRGRGFNVNIPLNDVCFSFCMYMYICIMLSDIIIKLTWIILDS